MIHALIPVGLLVLNPVHLGLNRDRRMQMQRRFKGAFEAYKERELPIVRKDVRVIEIIVDYPC